MAEKRREKFETKIQRAAQKFYFEIASHKKHKAYL